MRPTMARPATRHAARTRACAAALLLGLGLGAASPSWAFLGLLGKAGKAAKAVGVAKGGTAAGAAAVGADAIDGATTASRLAPDSAEALSKASGLGKAVPDEVAALLKTPGKTLQDIPDPLVRAWLGTPPGQQSLVDANAMVAEVERLRRAKTTAGNADAATTKPPMAANPQPWYALELTLRAAHLGHRVAQAQRLVICKDLEQPPALRRSLECQSALADPTANGT